MVILLIMLHSFFPVKGVKMNIPGLKKNNQVFDLSVSTIVFFPTNNFYNLRNLY